MDRIYGIAGARDTDLYIEQVCHFVILVSYFFKKITVLAVLHKDSSVAVYTYNLSVMVESFLRVLSRILILSYPDAESLDPDIPFPLVSLNKKKLSPFTS